MLRVGGKMENDETVGVASGFFLGGSDGQKQFVAGEFGALSEFLETCPVGFEFLRRMALWLKSASR